MDPVTLIILLALVAGGAWFFFFKKGGGIAGPDTHTVLQKLGPEYTVFAQAMLTTSDGFMRVDFLVVSPYAIFVIQERKEGGRVRVQPGQMEWEVNGGKGEPIHNPLWHNRKVINEIENRLGNVPMVSLVAITRARLEGVADQNVLRSAQLVDRIKRFSQPRIDAEQQRKVLALFGKG